MNGTVVSVKAGQIHVTASSADLLACAQLGGQFSAAGRAWLFPATPANARLLRSKLRSMRTTPEFEALLATPAAATLVPATTVAPQPQPRVEVEQADFVLPEGLRTRLWRHQGDGMRFALDKFAAGYHGLLLAMGMGTGKSLLALALMLWLKAKRVLIQAPLRVVQVWVAQIERHVEMAVVVAALDDDVGGVAKKMEHAAAKMRLAETMGVPFICVVNYDSAWREPFAAWAEKQRWDLGILDEAHRIKAASGKASLFCKRLRRQAAYRLALTGTPMPHSPLDTFPIVRALDITIFGTSFSAFRTKFAVMGGFHNKQVTGFQKLDELERLLSRITFRVTSDVLELPPATHVTYYCNLGPEAWRVYKDLDQDLVAEVRDGLITAANALVKLTRLQQVANGVVKTETGIEHRIDEAKRKLLADTLEDIGRDEPVVVFCRYHLDLDAVHEACQALGTDSLELSGRRDELAAWQEGKGQVLAVQISAGGVGVDLTRARFSIYYSLSFSLADYEQSEKRVHRPGQTRPVEYIHLVARNTVDTRIMRALERRAEIVESILAEIKN